MTWLKKMCEDYGLTEYQLAKKSKINQSTFSTIKKNNTPIGKIKSDNLEKIAKTVDASMDELKRWYK